MNEPESHDGAAALPAAAPTGAAQAVDAAPLAEAETRKKSRPLIVLRVPGEGPQDTEPRMLLLLWCLWLLGSWLSAMSGDSLVPSVHWMMLLVLAGMMLAYPALRLGQGLWLAPVAQKPDGEPAADAPGAAAAANADGQAKPAAMLPKPLNIFRDWVALFAVFQVVLLPLRFASDWTVAQTLWVDAAVGSWSLLSSAIVALGCRWSCPGKRMLAMLGCLALFFAEPLLLAAAGTISPGSAWQLRVSPLQAIWALTGPGPDWPAHPWSEGVLAVFLAATVLWAGVVALPALPRHPVPET